MTTNREIQEQFEDRVGGWSVKFIDYLNKYNGSVVYVPVGDYIKWRRRAGNTTRQANEIIECLYKNPNHKVLFLDHWNFENSNFENMTPSKVLKYKVLDRIDSYELECFEITDDYIMLKTDQYDNKNIKQTIP